MKTQELLSKMSSPTGLFTDHTDEGQIVYLAYPAEQEQDLRTAVQDLGELFKGEGAYIEINHEPTGAQYNIVISAPGLGTPLFFGELSCMANDYEALLQSKKDGDRVSLGFYIHQKEVVRTAAEIAAIKQQPGYDEQASITGTEPYFVSVKIDVAGKLDVKSDDDIEEPSGFVDLHPDAALARAAAVRAAKRKDETQAEAVIPVQEEDEQQD